MSAFGGVPLNMDPVSGDVYNDGPADAERLAHLEEMQVLNEQALADQARLIADQKAERDQLRGQLERTEAAHAQLAGDLTATQAGTSRRIAELESQLERATDIAVDKAVRVTELENELAGARVIIEARDSRVVQLESALERRNGQLADATEAAEEYRAELKRALEGIAALAHSTLGDD
jgi:chromosome segregation ATPase